MIKFLWMFRYFFYSLLQKKIRFLGYIGKPIFTQGLDKLYLGEKVRIFPNARIEIHKSKMRNSYIKICNNVSIGQSLHIVSQGKLIIYSDVLISSNVLITNVDHEYYDIHTPILNQPHVEKSTIIGRRCFIGFGVVIQAGTRLGKHCVVGANSVVSGVFPDYCVIAGSPARIIKQYNLKTEKWEKVG